MTVTTVGYGDLVPLTPMGKLIASVGMLTGVIGVAAIISIIGAEMQEVRPRPRRQRRRRRRGGGGTAGSVALRSAAERRRRPRLRVGSRELHVGEMPHSGLQRRDVGVTFAPR